MEGKGEFKFPDGKFYVGEMKNDQRHGFGKMTWYYSCATMRVGPTASITKGSGPSGR